MRTSGVPLGLSWALSATSNWAPGVRPMDPWPAFNFAVEIEGLLVGGFSEVSGLQSSIAYTDVPEGGVNDFLRKVPGQVTHANLVLKHGLTGISTLWDWYYNTCAGIIQRKNGTIALLDQRQVPVMWWNFRNALPLSWSGPTFHAASDEVAFEALELVHEGLTKPLLGQGAALVQGGLGMGRV
jgi:phage tail-like protein